jgi:hypothetical protein
MDPISRRALLFSLAATLVIGLAAFRVIVATTGGSLVWSDGLAYFFHARSLVIDGNSDITNEFDEFDHRYPADRIGSSLMDSIRKNVSRNSQGLIVSPWPIGMGLVAAPFYAAGYLAESMVARWQNREPDSYGLIPQYFFALSSLVFGWLGFWSTYLCCREIGDKSQSYVATFAVVLGSPAVFYIFVNPSMAHAVSFGICATFTLLWLRQWMRAPTVRVMAVLGFLLGLLIAIRLQNAIFGTLLAALVIRQVASSGWSRAIGLALAGIAACVAPLSALVLHSLAYSGAHVSLGIQQNSIAVIGNYPINIKSPFFWDVLFSCRHGAFNWTPVLALGTIGLLYCVRRKMWAVPLLIVFLLNVYLIGGIGIADPSGKIPTFETSNWNDHWKGGTSFGMRYLTEVTPIFAIGLAALLNLFFRTAFIKAFSQLVLITMIVWNGLLILAYGLNTVSRTHCVTYSERWAGVLQALTKVERNVR